MWQWPAGAWDGTEPNAAAVADQYTIATRGLGARARCHHATPCPTLAAIARPAMHDAGERSLPRRLTKAPLPSCLLGTSAIEDVSRDCERPVVADHGPCDSLAAHRIMGLVRGLSPSPPQRGGLRSTRRMRVALPGAPLQRRAGGGSARRVACMDASQFGVWAGCPVDKPRSPTADFPGRDARKARKRGGLLFGYFLLATQEKVTRPP